MFDVKPVKKTGDLDFEKILQVGAEINLRREPAIPPPVKPPLIEYQLAGSQVPVTQKAAPSLGSKHSVLREFEDALIEPTEPVVELARMGVRIHPFIKQKSGPRFIVRRKKKEPTIFAPLPASSITAPAPRPPIAQPAVHAAAPLSTPVSREIDFWLKHLGAGMGNISVKSAARPKSRFHLSFGKKFWVSMGTFVFVGLLGWLVVRGSIGAKENVIQNSGNAVANLEEAKQKLEGLDFKDAENSFALAYDDLNRASGTLNELGASFLSLFGNLPGLGKVRAANNLVEAGRNISQAGENLASALGTLYDSNPLSFLNASAGSGSLSKLFGEFRAVLIGAQRNIEKADNLLADIDSSVIPEDKQPLLLDFKEKIPQFQAYIGQAIDYSDFLLKFVGTGGKKSYLVLLQNNSELRPTGGFPGTYALVTFEDGNLAKVFVDDIYQIDSNLKENVIPPIPMQHITPNWGMRDANWFADFPASARKVEEFYKKDGGGGVDGVLTITPDVIAEIFKIIGPIDMPEYNLTLDQNNFLTEIQNEVEYQADRSRPKKILSDLQPKFFERLSQQSPANWLEIFKILTNGVEEKHILAYFNDSALEEAAIKNGMGGEVRGTSGDYLQVVFANVKGSKTDFVTDSSFNLQASIGEGGEIEHILTINRMHKGGDSEFGFYNKDNSAYVKIYVPEGSVLKEIEGQTITDFQPLLDYGGSNFKDDPDLESVENGIQHPVGGVDVFEESGRTVFGFWLIVKPKETKSVVLKYITPAAEVVAGNYNFYWQKQSGTDNDYVNFSFKLPYGASVTGKSPSLQLLGDNLVLNSDLSVDREIDIIFK